MSDELKNYHMDMEAFRRSGYAVIDWIVDYYNNVENHPVLAQVRPGEIRDKLPPHPPQRGETFSEMLKDVDEVILPGITHWQSPNFFAYFPANNSAPSILGELLSAGLGVQGMSWVTSPAATELESQVLDWLVEMLGLPGKFKSVSKGGGVIQDSASSAVLCALLAARERATGNATNRRGCRNRLTAYTSTQAHSSIEKACMIAGIGSENLRLIETDEQYALSPDKLLEKIREDKAAGFVPFFVNATLGTTSSMAIDPVAAVAEICGAEGLWLHVDAAMAGTAAVCPEFRYLHAGLENVDSYAVNPHKWMFTNFDCSAFFTADRTALTNALGVLPEYLKTKPAVEGKVIDYRDWQIPLGRRFRALKLWFVIRHYGVEGLRYHIRRHIELAQLFAGWVRQSTEFALAASSPLNLVCFYHRRGDALTEAIMHHVNGAGKMYLTHTKLDNRFILRLCVGQARTEREHVERAWQCLRQAAKDLQSQQL